MCKFVFNVWEVKQWKQNQLSLQKSREKKSHFFLPQKTLFGICFSNCFASKACFSSGRLLHKRYRLVPAFFLTPLLFRFLCFLWHPKFVPKTFCIRYFYASPDSLWHGKFVPLFLTLWFLRFFCFSQRKMLHWGNL